MSHRDNIIKKNKELSKPMDLMNVGFVGVVEPTPVPLLNWSTFSANITQRTPSSTGGGTSSSYLVSGLRAPASGNNVYGTTQSLNGTTWSNVSNQPTGVIHASGGGDSNSDHIVAGGYNISVGGNAGHNTTIKFNGSSWSTTGNLPSASWGFVGDGDTSDAIMGGNMGYGFGNQAAKFNGSNWSSISGGVGVVGTGSMAGRSTDAMHTYNGASEKYNGSSWSTLSSLSSTSAGNGGTGGNSLSCLAFGGGSIKTDEYDGSSWSTKNDFVSSSAGKARTCRMKPNGTGLSVWDGVNSAGNGTCYTYG